MADKVFCRKGKAYVIPNPYNRYEKRPEKCIYKNDKIPTICVKCIKYIEEKTR